MKRILLLAALACPLSACSHTIETSIVIEAPADRVWAEFSAFETWADWNPFIRSFAGKAELGETLAVTIQPPGSDSMNFTPVVTEVQPGRVFEWEGQVLLPGIFTGRHRFEIQPDGEGRTRFIHSERFSGALVPLFDFDPPTRGFEAMNQALKERSEAER